MREVDEKPCSQLPFYFYFHDFLSFLFLETETLLELPKLGQAHTSSCVFSLCSFLLFAVCCSLHTTRYTQHHKHGHHRQGFCCCVVLTAHYLLTCCTTMIVSLLKITATTSSRDLPQKLPLHLLVVLHLATLTN